MAAEPSNKRHPPQKNVVDADPHGTGHQAGDQLRNLSQGVVELARTACGAHVAGTAAALVVFPFEKVFIRSGVFENSPQYNSIGSGLRHIVQNEGGYFALYRGLSVRLFRVAATTTPLLVLEDSSRQWLNATLPGGGPSGSVGREAAAGFIAGGSTFAAHAPFDVVRLRVQTMSPGYENPKVGLVSHAWRSLAYSDVRAAIARTTLRGATQSTVLFGTFAAARAATPSGTQLFGADTALNQWGVDVAAGTVAVAAFVGVTAAIRRNFERIGYRFLSEAPALVITLSTFEAYRHWRGVKDGAVSSAL